MTVREYTKEELETRVSTLEKELATSKAQCKLAMDAIKEELANKGDRLKVFLEFARSVSAAVDDLGENTP